MKWVVWIGAFLIFLVAVVAAIGAMLPKSHRGTRRARFRQKPEAVYATIAGPPTWRGDVKDFGGLSETGGRKQWWEQDRHGQKITYELVDDSPPSRRVVRITDKNLPYGGTWTFEIAPEPQGSSLRIIEDGEVYNVIFRFISRFVFGYTGTIERCLRDLGRKFGEITIIEE